MSGYPRKHPTARWAMPRGPECDCGECSRRYQSGYTEPMGGCDADGNPLTVSFGYGNQDNNTLLGDGDRSEVNFRDHENHNHYGPGNGRNNNVKDRGQYHGRGH